MPGLYTPTARLRDAVPALPNGDPKDLPTWRVLLDALAHQQQATGNRLTWSGEFSVDPGGSASAFTVHVGAFYGLTLRDLASGTFLPYFTAGATLGAAAIEGGGPLASASWYFVYAWSNAGSIDFEISLTGPSASHVRKAGATDAALARVYLGCFRTSSTGAPFPLRAVRGRYRYRRSAIASVGGSLASDGLGALVGGGAIARTDLDLSSRIPPHARMALLQGHLALLAGAGTGLGALNLYSAADTSSIAVAIAARAEGLGAKAENSSSAEIELTSAQVCGYSVTQTLATAVGDLDVLGWEE